ELWGAIRKTFGLGKDSVYTIDLTTGEATPVGVTGFNVLTNDLSFDGEGNLYGVNGASNIEGKFFQIDQTNGTGTLIGTGVGYNHTTGLAYSINGPVLSVDGGNSTLPQNYSLKQNYPNPFNPTTKIEFSLPIAAEVQLVVYNILGQQVASLINEQQTAGNHSILWNADDSKGMKLSSGIYLYKLKANGIDGSEFQETRKMILLK
ncbi:MAG: T9SS type A sorting domain-containing protein, partial [Ignavibacteriaceae bacterium]|nr:T9SS type A sorting domain-containing protein [Ignavibacteriaceae bacterium]